mmetsp:Transcript_30664/g.55802  ORF Transcript_30664/g.55802 Transcript_30664/m.55802 type:complete len:312 (-) Transcript_30664:921-1856(-)
MHHPNPFLAATTGYMGVSSNSSAFIWYTFRASRVKRSKRCCSHTSVCRSCSIIAASVSPPQSRRPSMVMGATASSNAVVSSSSPRIFFLSLSRGVVRKRRSFRPPFFSLPSFPNPYFKSKARSCCCHSLTSSLSSSSRFGFLRRSLLRTCRLNFMSLKFTPMIFCTTSSLWIFRFATRSSVSCSTSRSNSSSSIVFTSRSSSTARPFFFPSSIPKRPSSAMKGLKLPEPAPAMTLVGGMSQFSKIHAWMVMMGTIKMLARTDMSTMPTLSISGSLNSHFPLSHSHGGSCSPDARVHPIPVSSNRHADTSGV